MKKFALASLAMATVLAIAPAAMADQVTGSIAISGNNMDTFTTTGITFKGMGTATGTDTLSTVSGSATLTSFTFSSPDVELFDVTTGPDSPVTFTITGPVTESIVNGILNVSGTGTLTEAGFTSNTAATFNLSSSVSGDITSLEITATGPAATPEPSSLLLLGTGLLGMALVLFRKAKPAAGLKLNM